MVRIYLWGPTRNELVNLPIRKQPFWKKSRLTKQGMCVNSAVRRLALQAGRLAGWQEQWPVALCSREKRTGAAPMLETWHFVVMLCLTLSVSTYSLR